MYILKREVLRVFIIFLCLFLIPVFMLVLLIRFTAEGINIKQEILRFVDECKFGILNPMEVFKDAKS